MGKITTAGSAKQTEMFDPFDKAGRVAARATSGVDHKLREKDLSVDQRSVYDAIVGWIDGGYRGDLLTCGGFAGVGKTALISVLADGKFGELRGPVAYVTFTGRASSVVRRKLKASGIETTNMLQATEDKNGDCRPIMGYSYDSMSDEADLPFCGTIHRLLYKPIVDTKTEEILGWTKRDRLDRGYALIVIDEASQVGDEMLRDLQVHRTPILAVGDHGQLPPVMDRGSLMEAPMLRLEKIHRQAEGNPIIQLSRAIREQRKLDRSFEDGKAILFESRRDITYRTFEPHYANASTPLDVGTMCWTNKNRIKLNGLIRKALGYVGSPRSGEVVMCLKNKPPVYNGMRGLLTADATQVGAPWHLYARVEFPDEGIEERGYTLCATQFNRDKTYRSVDELHERGINVTTMGQAGELWDFGAAMTVHRSQGSQFKTAIFYNDMPRDHAEWAKLSYTAVTRASERLVVLT